MLGLLAMSRMMAATAQTEMEQMTVVEVEEALEVHTLTELLGQTQILRKEETEVQGMVGLEVRVARAVMERAQMR